GDELPGYTRSEKSLCHKKGKRALPLRLSLGICVSAHSDMQNIYYCVTLLLEGHGAKMTTNKK
ncbi:MAG: hypothetical protein SOZ60_07740, partial [Prevotella sp.]|nr:hypothetical protein [Prevotella sp.]